MPTASTSHSTFDPRHHVGVHAERVSNVSSTDFPGYYPDEDHSWDLDQFNQRLKVKVQRLSGRSIEFDLVGTDASIANAFRRILIAEVPTISVERVYVWDNTSVVVDEILAQRIGLVPLNVDPAWMDTKETTNDQATDRNTLVFRLKVACERNKNAPKGSTDPREMYINSDVLSSHLEWEPQGEQATVFASSPPAPTNPNIVLGKLRPGQEIDIEMHAVKGVGKDHAKFCPVATASYRLLPLVILNPEKPVPPHLAEKFQKCFSPGVIRVDPQTKAISLDEQNMRKESMSREVYRHPEFEGCTQLARVRDHFLFSIESEGFYPPERLLPESISVMRGKIANIRRAAEALLADNNNAGDVVMADA
ncbi:hypothetical protein SERLA73DRAFT_178536 [Serpula lacrymans var. lacrymans S7.3]|uniref:DNA-directed RNA polymerases I and III subunit RPAC1 n=2 Tax=Serpula lacrymans var. lacrymans TaxID=341189 RepID=F8PRZ9_SERL3|nr:uncharacterized protein SERLADRAFT_447454 [Serpula lacrymans var. lacrymans S7.9]EGO00665.1 hypothetical protein SERLA73DRAFT_178536 [Serpula lacrymans var. lacrymans S7.3]EGO26217.1 hypothetical protein SERLADRAFT_447454 [Serpula lacrymans var. lacrymans S7.9]